MENDLLEMPIYGMSQVDRLLSLPSGTASRWIDGYERGGKFYEPVVRLEKTNSELVTWGEFVEARFLALFRKHYDVPMLRMRPAIMRMRETFETKYPLATVKPFSYQREIVYSLQSEDGIDIKSIRHQHVLKEDSSSDPKTKLIVVARNNQYVLTAQAEEFVNTTEFNDEFAVRVRPLGLRNSVSIDPLHHFGEPAVRSVPTEALAENFRAGDPVDMLAEIYELSREDVESAIRYELDLATAA